MSDPKVPGEEKSIDAPVTAPEAGVEREDAQPDPRLTPVLPEEHRPVTTRQGMWSQGTGDTSGYGRIVRSTPWPPASEPPFGSWFDEAYGRLASLVADPFVKVVVDRGELTFHIAREKLTEVMQALRDDALLRFEFCASVSGVHLSLIHI